LRLTGPAVQSAQWAFVEDWYWAMHMTPDLQWQEEEAVNGKQQVLILHSGPVDTLETCGLYFMHLINVACKRVWIASPYFVPDRQLMSALQLAALRGCDVRIMLPERPDHLLVYLSSFAYMHETATENIRFYRYQPGFLHQKAILIDDDLSAIGTAILDNRSDRLYLEIMANIVDPEFAQQVETMFLKDFEHCIEVNPHELESRSFFFRLAISSSRLLAPIQ
jgi:cardiolipin synthase